MRRFSLRSIGSPLTICALVLKVAAFVSLGVILISTLVFILSTLPELQDAEDGAEEDEKTGDDNAAAATATDVT